MPGGNWGSLTNFERFAKDFLKDNEKSPDDCIHWFSSYYVSVIPQDKLFKLFDLAMPYKVVASEDFYNEEKYREMEQWVADNCESLFTHVNVHFWFEKEEDAVQFKLVWG